MNEPLDLEIMTTTGIVLRDRIVDLYIPAFFGEAGILSHHLPYISILKTGELSYLDAARKRRFLYIANGFLEVRDNRIVIMADAIEKGEEMDGAALQQQLAGTESRIKSSFSGQITPEELAGELERSRQLRIKLEIWKKTEQP